MKPVNLLVLGLGGNVSQGILKAIRASRLNARVIGACVNPFAAGLYAADAAYISPWADSSDFLDWLLNVCCKESVHGILSGVEPVLEVLAEHRDEIHAKSGAIAIVSPPSLLALCTDKLRTSEWLCSVGLAAPGSAMATDAKAVNDLAHKYGYPLIAKPRFGKGSSDVRLVRSADELAEVLRSPAQKIIQEHVGCASQEYTIATFSDRHGRMRGAITMRRELVQGTTSVAEVVRFPEVRRYAAAITAALRPAGPCNIQLRQTDRGPVCFEINMRFSGTTALRAHFGFNDVEAAVRHFVLGEQAIDLPDIQTGLGLRYWNEIFVDPAAARQLSLTNESSNPQRAVKAIESLGGTL